ncbi:MAG: hypothetical protein R3325_05580 [Thermoanaerobaculia bacterium]|nr:hypothetical protein [Thermoanaerobaculia bacterium]
MRSLGRASLAAILLIFTLAPGQLHAGVLTRTYDFVTDDWLEIDETDGPITLHRIRLEPQKGRLTKATLARPHNQEYLQPLVVQLEYTNGSDRKWRARVSVRWLDEEGRIIDGIGANETLDKKSAKKLVEVSLSTLKYGVARAETLEVSIHYDP